MKQALFPTMTAPPGTILNDYRASIALNNMGISLLERRAYLQAIATFKDAVVAMRSFLRRREGIHRQQLSGQETISIQSILHEACKRLAQPRPMCPYTMLDLVVVDDDQDGCLPIRWIAAKSATSASSGLELKRGENSIAPVAFPIRLALAFNDARMESSYHCVKINRNLDRQSAAILCNFGLAYLCLSRLGGGCSNPLRSQATVLSQRAIKLFHTALSLLFKSCTRQLHSQQDWIELCWDGRLQLYLIVLRSIVCATLELGNLPLAAEYYHEFRETSALFERLHTQSAEFTTHAAAAA